MWTLTLTVLSLIIASSNAVLTPECSGTFKEDGALPLPDPSDVRYSNKSLLCVWHFEAPETKKVVLKISKYAFETAATCLYVTSADYLAVFDGKLVKKDKRLALLCSNGQDLVIPSTNNTLTVKFIIENFKPNSLIAHTVFTYPESVGCGGNINLENKSSYTLNSPEVTDYKKGDVFDCLWNFKAPAEGDAIRVELSAFNNFSCEDNDVLEIIDGHAPDSLVLGKFCGETLPPVVISSSNMLRVRLTSTKMTKFTAKISVFKSCSPINSDIRYTGVTKAVVPVASGINCRYVFRSNVHNHPVRVSIENLNIQSNKDTGKCESDKLILRTRSGNEDLNQYFNLNNQGLQYFSPGSKLNSLYDGNPTSGQQYEICGQKSLEFYFRRIPFEDRLFLNIMTAPDSTMQYNDFKVNLSYIPYCEQNFTKPYGRIINRPESIIEECNQLITAPEGHTISLYFMSYKPAYYDTNETYIDFYDGKTNESAKIFSTYLNDNLTEYNIPSPIFSKSNHILMKSVTLENIPVGFDSIYMITDKGQGCGGYFFGDQGIVTSPLYPETYNETKSCEWVLESPQPTRMRIIFDNFDLSGDCDSNYVELVDRQGKVLSRFCSEKPGVFTSNDNYIKVVSVTGPSNDGKGWHALFGGV